MLPGSERLRKAGLFKRIYAARKGTSCGLFTLYVIPKQAGSALRLPLSGFVVGKKVHNKANRRNLVKRRVREAYRLARKKYPTLLQWYAIVFLIHDKALTASFQEIQQTVEESIVKAEKRFGRAIKDSSIKEDASKKVGD